MLRDQGNNSLKLTTGVKKKKDLPCALFFDNILQNVNELDKQEAPFKKM